MTRALSPTRSGMTLVELLVGVVISLVILQGVVGYFTGQSRMVGQQESQRAGRETARAALQLFTSELRRLERVGAVEEAEARQVTVRVPYAIGVVCASSSFASTVALLPTDSLLFANAVPSGIAWRDGDGEYNYITSGITVSTGFPINCTDVQVTPVAGGRVVSIAPGLGPVPVGTPLMVYQRVRYQFRDGPAGASLVRTLLATGQEEVLMEPFDYAGTRFRFITDPVANAVATPPADLSTVRGLEVRLQALGDRPGPDGSAAARVPITATVLFRN